MTKQLKLAAILALLAALWTLSACFYTLSEKQAALVVRLGAPQRVVAVPGLHFKQPFIDSVVYFDNRLQFMEPSSEQVILGDQKRVEIDPYTIYRISDPLRFYQAVHTMEQARAILTQIVSTSLRRELGQVSLSDLLSTKRIAMIGAIRKEVAARVAPLGITIAEIRFHRADLPPETSEAIYDRMKSERQREAKQLRAQGAEWAQQITAEADRQRTVILSEAQRQADITRGEADAQANLILTTAYSKDPRFYKFYRSLKTYGGALADSAPTLLLSPNVDFLRTLKNGPAAGKR
ncbi:MAG TPA: protease modulator HflC [Parasulfuritortus sp.]